MSLRDTIADLVERYDCGDFDDPLPSNPHTALADAVMGLPGIAWALELAAAFKAGGYLTADEMIEAIGGDRPTEAEIAEMTAMIQTQTRNDYAVIRAAEAWAKMHSKLTGLNPTEPELLAAVKTRSDALKKQT